MESQRPGTPHHEQTTLDSGLRVLSSTLAHTNAVSIMLLFGAGSRYESDELAGSSHLFEHLLFKGTSKRPTPTEISEVVEGVGGVLNAFTDREMTGYWCRVPSTSWADGMDVLTDMVKDPLFREDDISREKHVVYEEIRASHDDPGSRADTLLDDMLWPDQAFGRDIAGSEESVGAVSREAMLEYMSTQYVPTNTVVTVAGGVTHAEVVDAVERMMGGWPGRDSISWYPVEDRLAGPLVNIEHRPTEQGHLAMGLHGLSSRDDDRYALRLMCTTLGEGMSSRLFTEVREKRGLAYAIGAGTSAYADAGALGIYGGVDPERAAEAVKVIADELVKLWEGVSPEELEKAKRLTKGRTMLRMEESRAVAMSIGAQELIKGEIEGIDEMLAAMDAVTLDDIRDVAKRVIRSDKTALSLVGPFDDDAPFLEALQF
jgi:predicted Zn-dependent peptidase